MTIDPALLDSGERLLWSGQPNPLRYAQSRSGISVIAGLAALVFAQIWTTTARASNPWLGAAFFLVAFALLLSPLWRMWRAYRTAYGVTDRRALTVIGPPFARQISVPLDQIHSVEIRLRPGRLGDVLFGDADHNSFIAVADVDAAARLLRSSSRTTR
jgi:hypothetical protein